MSDIRCLLKVVRSGKNWETGHSRINSLEFLSNFEVILNGHEISILDFDSLFFDANDYLQSAFALVRDTVADFFKLEAGYTAKFSLSSNDPEVKIEDIRRKFISQIQMPLDTSPKSFRPGGFFWIHQSFDELAELNKRLFAVTDRMLFIEEQQVVLLPSFSECLPILQTQLLCLENDPALSLSYPLLQIKLLEVEDDFHLIHVVIDSRSVWLQKNCSLDYAILSLFHDETQLLASFFSNEKSVMKTLREACNLLSKRLEANNRAFTFMSSQCFFEFRPSKVGIDLGFRLRFSSDVRETSENRISEIRATLFDSAFGKQKSHQTILSRRGGHFWDKREIFENEVTSEELDVKLGDWIDALFSLFGNSFISFELPDIGRDVDSSFAKGLGTLDLSDIGSDFGNVILKPHYTVLLTEENSFEVTD